MANLKGANVSQGLSDAARAAREAAATSADPVAHRYALALEGAVVAEEKSLGERLDPKPEPNLEGIPPPPVDTILIRKPPPPDTA
jgi:hypothetical protein